MEPDFSRLQGALALALEVDGKLSSLPRVPLRAPQTSAVAQRWPLEPGSLWGPRSRLRPAQPRSSTVIWQSMFGCKLIAGFDDTTTGKIITLKKKKKSLSLVFISKSRQCNFWNRNERTQWCRSIMRGPYSAPLATLEGMEYSLQSLVITLKSDNYKSEHLTKHWTLQIPYKSKNKKTQYC